MILSKKAFPLTVGQQVILMQQTYSADKSISNICMAIHFEKEIDDAVMMQALSNALYRNHSSSIQIRMLEDGSQEQYFAKKSPEAIDIVDFSEKSEEDLQRYLEEEASKAFAQDSFDVPLYRMKYILKPNGKSAVYFVVCHIAFDAYFMMFLAQDAFEVYHCLKEGLPLPKTLRSPEEYFMSELEYLQSPRFLKDKEFWDTCNPIEPLYTTLTGKKGPGMIEGKRYGILGFSGDDAKSSVWFGRAPAELVEKANQFSKDHGVSVQSLFILPLRNAISLVNDGEEDISIVNPFARRATKIEKEVGGSRVSAIPLRMNFSNDLSFLEAAKVLSKTILVYFKHADLPYPFMVEADMRRYNLEPMHGYTSVGFTYQPYAMTAPEDLPFHLQYVSNGQSSQALYLTWMSLDSTGDLVGIYEYNHKAIPSLEIVEKLHHYILKCLDDALDHPEKSLRELMELYP